MTEAAAVARERVLSEILLIARAIGGMGGEASVDAITEASGLPVAVVTRRLCGSGGVAPLSVPRYFACVKRATAKVTDRRRGWGKPGVWRLTAAGEELVRGGPPCGT